MTKYLMQYVYQSSDFATAEPLIAPPKETSARAVDSAPFDISLKPGVTAQQVTVTDTPSLLHQHTVPLQIIAAPLTLDGVTYAAGTRITINYTVSTRTGFEGYYLTLGANTNAVTGFVTNQPMIAGTTYTFTSNANVNENPVPYSEFACFTAGTRIKTAKGEQCIECLRVGDRVMTRDHGLQTIRWTGQRTLPALDAMAPIAFDAGVLGCTTRLLVSPNHRVLIAGAMAELVCGDTEMLIAASLLVNDRNVRRVAGGLVNYVQIMFDYHEIIWANDCPTESFYVHDQAIDALDAHQTHNIRAPLPAACSGDTAIGLARAVALGFEGTVIGATL